MGRVVAGIGDQRGLELLVQAGFTPGVGYDPAKLIESARGLVGEK